MIVIVSKKEANMNQQTGEIFFRWGVSARLGSLAVPLLLLWSAGFYTIF